MINLPPAIPILAEPSRGSGDNFKNTAGPVTISKKKAVLGTHKTSSPLFATYLHHSGSAL